MVAGGHEPRLTQKSLTNLILAHELAQKFVRLEQFQGHDPAQGPVPDFIDSAHAAPAKRPQYIVASNLHGYLSLVA